MGLVSDGCQDSGSDRMSDWGPLLEVGSSIMGFPTSRVYRQCVKIYTDHWEAYAAVLPSKRHKSVDKESGLTSYIERLNNTLRQRIWRLVRKTLSFSKKLENHKGAIWNFIHDYNHQIRLAMLKAQPPQFYPSFT
jgi:insertion element IS1 protein InsB